MFAGVLVVAVGVGAGGWYLIHGWLGAASNGEVPLIRADTSPIKVRPEQPGGMEVPNRDKLVYDAMSGSSSRPAVEHLLPPPETPLPKPAPAPGTAGTATAPQAPPVPPAAVASAAPAAPTASPPPPPALPGKAPGQVAPTPLTPPTSQKAGPSVKDVLTAMQPPPAVTTRKPPAVVASETKPAPVKNPAVAGVGAFRVQLSALRSRQEVDRDWNRLRRQNPDLLGNLHLSVMRVDLGPGKGIFFRLRAGPLADEQAAKNLCQKLSERKIGCLVVRPEG